jgi:hypothetical protein
MLQASLFDANDPYAASCVSTLSKARQNVIVESPSPMRAHEDISPDCITSTLLLAA